MTSIILKSKNIKRRSESGKVYFTYSDVENLPEWPDSELLEILMGELFVVPSPTIDHQRISKNIYNLLNEYLIKNNGGEIFYSPIDVILSEENVVIPDLLFISNKNKGIISKKNIIGTPDLIIEILSKNRTRDLVEKKKIYKKYKVKEYWIIDIEKKQVYVNTLINSDFKEKTYKNLDENIQTNIPELANIELDLEIIFEI